MATLERAEILELLDGLSEKPSIRRNLFAYLRHFFGWALERSLVVGNPLRDVKSPRSAPPRPREFELHVIASIQVDPPRGKAAIEAILRAYGVPLSRAEISFVFSRLKGTWGPSEVEWNPEQGGEVASEEERLMEDEVGRRVRAFYVELNGDERRLLSLRGWGNEAPSVSFRDVAGRMGRRTHEHWRLKERAILRVFAELFADDARAACKILSRLIREDEDT